MKFRVKKGTFVATHSEGMGFEWGTSGDWGWKDTEFEVTFGEDEIWFIPDAIDKLFKDANTEETWKVVENRCFGFKLPPNKTKIDYIIVKKKDVEVIKESGISEHKKIVRRLRRQGGEHWFQGSLT